MNSPYIRNEWRFSANMALWSAIALLAYSMMCVSASLKICQIHNTMFTDKTLFICYICILTFPFGLLPVTLLGIPSTCVVNLQCFVLRTSRRSVDPNYFITIILTVHNLDTATVSGITFLYVQRRYKIYHSTINTT
jgi:hypothetical protein